MFSAAVLRRGGGGGAGPLGTQMATISAAAVHTIYNHAYCRVSLNEYPLLPPLTPLLPGVRRAGNRTTLLKRVSAPFFEFLGVYVCLLFSLHSCGSIRSVMKRLFMFLLN